MNTSPESMERSVVSINNSPPNNSPLTKRLNEINESNEVVIEIKDLSSQNLQSVVVCSTTPLERKKDDCKTIVKNMLKTRSRSSNTPISPNTNNTPESFIDSEFKYSPSLDRKPYEIGNLGDPNLWTEETSQHLIDFSDICNDSADKCRRSSIKHRIISNILQISIILSGAIVATTSIGSIDDSTKNIISVVSGCMVVLFSSVHGYLKFPQKSEIEKGSCLELERMARSVKIELSKAKELRVDPYKYIIKLENQREKILKKVGIEDD